MPNTLSDLALESFRSVARSVPAYRVLLEEAGIDPDSIQNLDDFLRLPLLNKGNTFQRFPLDRLCRDGKLGRPESVLTSSGHSGVFAFGVNAGGAGATMMAGIDDLLDQLFEVRARPTLLINCLPMGVKIATQACTLAETSVRPDMALGLIRSFQPHFAQFILVGETAFIKHVLELGRTSGLDWTQLRVHLITGEEPLAENARIYLESILGIDRTRPGQGIVVSSMGVAELGLNLFFEAPPAEALIKLRRLLHTDTSIRHAILGPVDWVPSLFTYDPRRIFVEFDRLGRLIVTTLDPRLLIPLVRYQTGDRGQHLELPSGMQSALEGAGIDWDLLRQLPLVAVAGRGEHALSGTGAVYPEAVKEGIYRDVTLAKLTTANFRLVSGGMAARIRIQLVPGIQTSPEIEARFSEAIGCYVRERIEVSCEPYESFRSGMALDYERKFSYLGP